MIFGRKIAIFHDFYIVNAQIINQLICQIARTNFLLSSRNIKRAPADGFSKSAHPNVYSFIYYSIIVKIYFLDPDLIRQPVGIHVHHQENIQEVHKNVGHVAVLHLIRPAGKNCLSFVSMKKKCFR